MLVELKARFDEENNIEWSRRLEEAGCNVIYGLDGYKVHSKLCLITRREELGVAYYTQIGTGNYNEKTPPMGLSTTKRIGRVCLRKILNRRVRNRTHGGVRGRLVN